MFVIRHFYLSLAPRKAGVHRGNHEKVFGNLGFLPGDVIGYTIYVNFKRCGMNMIFVFCVRFLAKCITNEQAQEQLGKKKFFQYFKINRYRNLSQLWESRIRVFGDILKQIFSAFLMKLNL